MNESIKEEFSFRSILNEKINKIASLDIDDSLKDKNLFECVGKLFKVSDDKGWLKSDQSCTTNIKIKFEEIFKEFFNKDKGDSRYAK